jgi:H+-translocating NAD(P) transhydrogenase subunit alpha
MALSIGVPREPAPGERRVSIVPEVAARLIKDGFEVRVEKGAGEGAYQSDASYTEVGAALVDRAGAFGADVVTMVGAPAEADLPLLAAGRIVIGFLRPLEDRAAVDRLAASGATALAMELVPRITRAQKMDALSAMGTVGGYRAVLLAAEAMPRFFPLLTTAAGTIRPAKVLVLGAGVAGLQAIATAKRLGAVVSGYDVRAAAAEQVKSVGAKFIELELDTRSAEGEGGYAAALDADRQRRQIELLVPHIGEADVVITTALVPGMRAPLLITKEAVHAMKPGSIIVDLAAPAGGNCELTRPDEVVEVNGVRILAPTNIATGMSTHASAMYGRTVAALIGEFTRSGAFETSFEDEIFKSVCVTHGGAVVNPRLAPRAESKPTEA